MRSDGSDHVKIRLNSNREIILHKNCKATLGRVANLDFKLVKLYKAGQQRWRGRRPIVRGIAMNPVDHPHGGRTNGGRCSVTPWGILTKGFKTKPLVSRWVISPRVS